MRPNKKHFFTLIRMKIRKFQPATLGDDKVCLFIASRGSGKSTLIADVLWHKRNIPSGVAMSFTEGGNKFFSKYLPESYVYDEFNSSALGRVLRYQKGRAARLGKAKCPSLFIILDDCAFDKTVFKNPDLQEVFMNGRHYSVFLMLTLQYVLMLPIVMRVNSDVVFLMKDNNNNNVRKMWEQFGGVFDNFKDFKEVFDELTNDYGAMVINNNARSSNIEDVVFWYRAEVREPFKAGSRSFWSLHEQAFDRNHTSDVNRTRKRTTQVERIG